MIHACESIVAKYLDTKESDDCPRNAQLIGKYIDLAFKKVKSYI